MSKIDDGGRAFPVNLAMDETGIYASDEVGGAGMSLRDWFAGMALNGVQLAQIQAALTGAGALFLKEGSTAVLAYDIADALIARKRETEAADAAPAHP